MFIHRVMLGLLLAAVLASAIPARSCPPDTLNLVPCGDVTTWPDTPYRWMDIAMNVYAESYRNTYLYEQATVTVTACSAGVNIDRSTAMIEITTNNSINVKPFL